MDEEAVKAKKADNLDRIEREEMMIYSMFMAASLAGGNSIAKASKDAAAGIAELKRGFT